MDYDLVRFYEVSHANVEEAYMACVNGEGEGCKCHTCTETETVCTYKERVVLVERNKRM